MTSAPARPLWEGRTLAIVGILLIAFSLRSAVASLSPLYDHIAEDFAVPAAVAGLIGTVPPLCFAVFGLLASGFERRFGLERTTVAALVLMTAGLVVRAVAPDAVGLLLGSVFVFAGVGVGNVLVPALVKKYFPDRIALLTTVYSTTMAVSTTLPPLLAVPVADAAGWRISLGLWAVFALAALIPGWACPCGAERLRRMWTSRRSTPVRWVGCGACRRRGRSRSRSSCRVQSRTRASRGSPRSSSMWPG
ncbi:MFS transporter [Microbacterium sp.]|uniref:MFS transporter n=1 Tax=Microbacterium sp. TaxID=51671 RepID=UPI0037361791